MSIQLDRTQFLAAVMEEWSNLKSVFRKYESLPIYADQIDPIVPLMNFPLEIARPKIADAFLAGRAMHDDASQRGIKIKRLRVVPSEITLYMQFEFVAYETLISLGEHISVAREEKLGVFKRNDFLIFDEHSVALFNFDSSGVLLGGHIEKSKSTIFEYVHFFDELERNSDEFERWYKEVKKNSN